MKTLPFNGVLQKPFHLWERGDDSDVQSSHLAFVLRIAAEEGREDLMAWHDYACVVDTRSVGGMF